LVCRDLALLYIIYSNKTRVYLCYSTNKYIFELSCYYMKFMGFLVKKIKAYHSSKSAWLSMVSEAEQQLGYQLDSDLKHYLIAALGYFHEMYTPSMLMGETILMPQDSTPSVLHVEKMRLAADHCLILSGMFPAHIAYKMSLRGCVCLGQAGYASIALQYKNLESKGLADLYESIAWHFIDMLDVLLCLRDIAGQNQLSAHDCRVLAQYFNSGYARQKLAF